MMRCQSHKPVKSDRKSMPIVTFYYLQFKINSFTAMDLRKHRIYYIFFLYFLSKNLENSTFLHIFSDLDIIEYNNDDDASWPSSMRVANYKGHILCIYAYIYTYAQTPMHSLFVLLLNFDRTINPSIRDQVHD